MSLSEYITNCDDMEEKLSATEFIKTLKVVNNILLFRTIFHICHSRVSGSELLVKMRGRFQHRATEPVFHTLPTASEVRYVLKNRLYLFSIAGVEQRSSSGDRGSENALTMPQIESLVHTRRTDSAPIIPRSLHSKYVKNFSSNSDLSQL
ncbi:unnamed protein product [Angiostrongylus costaricensis]|uniref:Ras-GEF domain-containing protein n=1 Tax=Angiostrongylus costaricensis TaxID=334426 RepID=A0A0R3PI19_ANGCS|nr:unnamed protein product [Angiostrongylus costaricensis]